MKQFFFFTCIILGVACSHNPGKFSVEHVSEKTIIGEIPFDSSINIIHLTVALCDNKYQGIVPVPSSIGNGQDPRTNLYWGAAYGVSTYFRKSADWVFVKKAETAAPILERLVFKHHQQPFYLIADAWDGKYIEDATKTFLRASAGMDKDTIHVDNHVIGSGGNARMLAYIGHDGLMDFNLESGYPNADGRQRDAIILACYSKAYFEPYLKQANTKAYVWTTGLMAPEAYTFHDALAGYVQGEDCEKVRMRAAQAYHRYQKCGLRAANRLLVCD